MYQIHTALKSEKKDILRFYKSQRYPARFIGLDHCYTIKEKHSIIASVIVSFLSDENKQPFLHALVTNKQYHHQGIASQLLHHIQTQHPKVVCFADKSLRLFYLKNNMIEIEQDSVKQCLTEPLFLRFQSYQKKQQQLKLFIHR